MTILRLSTALLAVAAATAQGQTVDALIAEGDMLWEALRPEAALERYTAALQADPQRAETWWKTARAQVDVAKQLVHEADRDRRDSIFGVARAYAQSALNLDGVDADAHFVLALVLGQQSRTRGGRERVEFAREIYEAAARALELAPDHAGAEHILGAWHAEVRRLSGLTRFFAKTLLGAGFLGRGSWDSAVVHLERAVDLDPSHIFHRLELAQIYVDVSRTQEALAQLDAIVPLAPIGDVLDPQHKVDAARLREEIEPGPQDSPIAAAANAVSADAGPCASCAPFPSAPRRTGRELPPARPRIVIADGDGLPSRVPVQARVRPPRRSPPQQAFR